MALSNSTYLFGLLGLIIPILIHLWSKKESKILKVGSIKFLPESETSRSSSIQLNEKLLLLLRCLLLALVCILLANLIIEDKHDKASKLFLIEPSILSDSRVKRALDTLPQEQVRLWQVGFPMLEESGELDSVQSNQWELVKAIKSLMVDSITIFSTATINTIKGKRPASTRHIQWIMIDPLAPTKYIHRNLETEQENLILEGTSTSNLTKYQWKTSLQSSDISEPWDSISIALFYDEEFERDKIYLHAALKSITHMSKRPIAIKEHMTSNFNSANKSPDWIIWLSTKQIPTGLSSKILKYRADNFANIISGNHTKFYLNQRLDSKNVVSEDLAGKVLRSIIPLKNDEIEVRQLNLSQLSPTVLGKVTQEKTNTKSLNDWGWWMLVIMLCLERYFSLKRGM